MSIKVMKKEPFVWNEPTPDFYITELSRNTIRFHNAVHGRQEFSKKQMGDCVVPVWFTTPPAAQPAHQEWVGLTDVEWMNIVNKNQAWFGYSPDEVAHEVAKLVEARLKEKNTKKD
jgi:hypothetical protein